MKFLPALLGLGAGLLALVGLAKAKGGSSPPSGSEPPSNVTGKPVQTTARAASGRVYTVWMWPEVPGFGVWTVVSPAASTVWMAFLYNKNKDLSIPQKLDPRLTDQSIIRVMREDWRMPV